MLVSLMSRLNAISLKNNAQYAMMQNQSCLMNTLRSPAFCGMNMETLQQMDNHFAINNEQNRTLYMLASAQERAAAELMNNEAKNNKISYIA